MPASASSLIELLDRQFAAAGAGMDVVARARVSLLPFLAQVPECRSSQGLRHSVCSVLAAVACAVAAGKKSIASIARWCAGAPPMVLGALGALGVRYDALSGEHEVPAASTFTRVLHKVDAPSLERAVCGWLAQRCAQEDSPDAGQGGEQASTDAGSEAGAGLVLLPAVAADGKVAKGTLDGDGRQVMLLSAVTHGEGIVLNQRRISVKTNEITQLQPLLEPLDLAGKVVTVDALNTQRKHACGG